MVLPRPEENPNQYFDQPLEDLPHLQEEYYEGADQLLNRIRNKGFSPIIVLAYGSLTREKTVKMQPDSDKLESDADFMVIVEKKFDLRSLKTMMTGMTTFGRQEEGGIVGEKPFSEHIPNFDVKVMTVDYCMKELDEIIDFFKSYTFPTDWVDLVDNERGLKLKKTLPEILNFGIPMYKDEKKIAELEPLQQKIAEAQELITKHNEQYQFLQAHLQDKSSRSWY